MGSKELYLKIWTNLDFWAGLGFIGVWAWNVLALEGWLDGKVNSWACRKRLKTWAEILSWIKIKCKIGLVCVVFKSPIRV